MKTTGLLHIIRNRVNREQLYSKAEYWDSKAEELEGHAVSMWPNNILNALYHDEQIQLFRSLIGDVDGKIVLDVGCGTGRISRFLAERGAQVTGIDFSTKAIEIARQHQQIDNPLFRELSIFELADSEKYDIIVSWGCLVMAARNPSELNRALDVLRNASVSGATVLLLEPIHRGFLHRVLNMNEKEFRMALEANGFKVESVTQMHFWPVRLVLAFLDWPGFVTTPIYHLGQNLMKLRLFNSMGDYKAIKAIRM